MKVQKNKTEKYKNTNMKKNAKTKNIKYIKSRQSTKKILGHQLLVQTRVMTQKTKNYKQTKK